MRSKYFLSIALCGLLTAVSCNTRSRVKSVFVDPARGVYNYAVQGDTLEFQALNPNGAPFYVIFQEPSPCAETYLKVTKDKPGNCKVQARSGLFRFRMSDFPPINARKPQPCPGCQYLRPCTPECIIVIPRPGQPIEALPPIAIPSPSPDPAMSEKNSEGTPIPVVCKGGTVNVSAKDAANGDTVFWENPEARGTDLSITIPAGVCKGTGSGQTVLKQLQPCILDAMSPSYPHSYSYSVQMNGVSSCGAAVTGTLNIQAANPAPTEK